MKEAFEQTAQTTNRRSFLGVLKIPLASELTVERKIACNPVFVDQNVYVVDSGDSYSLLFHWE